MNECVRPVVSRCRAFDQPKDRMRDDDDDDGDAKTTTHDVVDDVVVVLVDEDDRRVGSNAHQKRVRAGRGRRRGKTTYGSTVGVEDDDDRIDDDDDDDDGLGLFVSSKAERRRTTRGARALATAGVAALVASGCGRVLAAVRESGTSTTKSMNGARRVDQDVALRSVSGWDAAAADLRNFGRVGSRASRRLPRAQ